jgi:predicted RNA-binding protein YlqC (UPF0109 family)
VKDLLSSLVRPLVEEPQRVSVREHRDEEGTVLELKVAPGDRGRVIGRRGRTAEALRTVLGAVAKRQGTSCDMEILG